MSANTCARNRGLNYAHAVVRRHCRRDLFTWRNFVWLCHVAILPVSLHAQDVSGAILHTTGSVLLNTTPAPPSAALFGSSHIETQPNSAARISASGSTADIGPETIVDYENSELSLNHGSLSLNTTIGWKVRIGCRLFTPANESQWTQYEVVDVSGKIMVSALKGDLYLDSRQSSSHPAKHGATSTRITIRAGERQSVDEKCDEKETKLDDRLPGIGPILNSPWAIIIGSAAIGTLTCWALCFSGPNPASPSKPQ